MIRFACLFLALSLAGCTAAPDLRPDVYIRADGLLQHGIEAYENDDYPRASQHFKQSLALYQSIDNVRGVQLAHFNLANNALAYSDFKTASTHLDFLTGRQNKGLLTEKLTRRLLLLRVKFHFLRDDYAEALRLIKPLSAGLAMPPQPDLTLLAALARLEVLDSAGKITGWLEKFQTALSKLETKDEKWQASLERILGHVAFKKGDYGQAAQSFNRALAYYKKQAKRRGIAVCLQRLADIELARKRKAAAVEYLEKALKIYQWIKDDYRAGKIAKQLGELSVVVSREIK